MIEFLSFLSLGTAIACLLMGFIYWAARRLDNYGVVDIAWSWGFALLTLIYAGLAGGDSTRKWIVSTLVLGWSGRLGWHLFRRISKEHPREDGRYQQLRHEWGENTPVRMFWFYQMQAIVLAFLSSPFLVITLNSSPGLSRIEWAGALLVLVSLAGEGLADFQLKRFKSRASNHGRVCDQGLWGYSRHPNYFFEWMVWVGFFVLALGSPYGWTTIYCPLLMLWFLLKVTGIPATEEQALRTKGEAYRRYQKTTSAFIPWFNNKKS
jgi:steroid 5-alpha reductase family enzyme